MSRNLFLRRARRHPLHSRRQRSMSVIPTIIAISCAVLVLTVITSKRIIIFVNADSPSAIKEKLHPSQHNEHNDIIIHASKNNIGQHQTTHHQHQHQHQHLRRKALYLPPAPVAPFRGGLKSVVPNDDDDDDDQEDNSSSINNIESSEDSQEAWGSSDPNDRSRDPGVYFSPPWNRDPSPRINFPMNNKSSSSSSSSASASPSSSWAPQDYPDPWTNPILCGGAATASLIDDGVDDLQQPQHPYSRTDLGLGKTPQQEEMGMRRPLFCDPDRVLDKETLRNVAVKLRSFAEAFAFSDVTEGGDFGADRRNAEDDSDGQFGTSENNANSNDGQILNDNQEADNHNRDNLPQPRPSPDSPEAGEVDRNPSRKLRLVEKQMYSDSVGGTFSTTHRVNQVEPKRQLLKGQLLEERKVEIAIALVQKINLPAILRSDSYFFYSDQDDMVNDAAQYFARYIHDTWSRRLAKEQKANNNDDGSTPTSLVLIFISTIDRICYISSGTKIAAILPWWRLEHVVEDMKQDLRKGHTGDALYIAIEDLTALLQEGPPSFTDRVNDFFERFGIVMLFTVFTFVFATWGECRDRRKRLYFVERRSRMTAAEKEKARLLQKEFKTKTCPICLEPFGLTPEKDDDTCISLDKEKPSNDKKQKLKRVDSYDNPLFGSDDQPIKMLRCGHIFDQSCWQIWTDSGQGNPYVCPVCRQDVGRPKNGSNSYQRNNSGEGGSGDNARETYEEERANQEESSLFMRIVANATGPSMLLRPVNNTQPNYNSIQPQIRNTPLVTNTPFAPLSHPTLRRLHPMFGIPSNPPIERTGEQTPLFAQASSTSNEDDDDY